MPRPRAVRFSAWSYSRWRAYEECPAKARWSFLEKVKEEGPKGPALIRGQEIHDEAKLFVQGKTKKLPESLGRFDVEFAILRRAYQTEDMIVEEQWALNRDWKQTGWFDPDAWVRVVLDAAVIDWKQRKALIVDHKTGRVRPMEQQPQLELYATAALSRLPEIDEVSVALWYLDHGRSAREKYTRLQLPALQRTWEKRTKRMLSDERHDPKPSENACRFCPFKKSEGGPCRF